MNDPSSPLSRPSPKKKVRQFGADWLTRLTQTMKGFQVPHNGMASRDILDRELIANGSNNNIRNPVLNISRRSVIRQEPWKMTKITPTINNQFENNVDDRVLWCRWSSPNNTEIQILSQTMIKRTWASWLKIEPNELLTLPLSLELRFITQWATRPERTSLTMARSLLE